LVVLFDRYRAVYMARLAAEDGNGQIPADQEAGLAA
jgi:hypothetical protein